MNTIIEDLDDPIGHIRRVREQISAEYGHDREKYWAAIKQREAELKARGIKFVDFSTSTSALDSSTVREESPPSS